MEVTSKKMILDLRCEQFKNEMGDQIQSVLEDYLDNFDYDVFEDDGGNTLAWAREQEKTPENWDATPFNQIATEFVEWLQYLCDTTQCISYYELASRFVDCMIEQEQDEDKKALLKVFQSYCDDLCYVDDEDCFKSVEQMNFEDWDEFIKKQKDFQYFVGSQDMLEVPVADSMYSLDEEDTAEEIEKKFPRFKFGMHNGMIKVA